MQRNANQFHDQTELYYQTHQSRRQYHRESTKLQDPWSAPTGRLKWDIHVNYMHKKACKKLYSLRILRRAGVDRESILKVYLTTIRAIMGYAVPVWQSIPISLSDKLESVQRRALKIIYPAESYSTALQRAQIDSLSTRRHQLRVKFVTLIKPK